MKKGFLLFFALTSALLAGQAQKSIYNGKCVGVHDGDTITVLVNNRQLKVRLEGIDAPELGQDFSQRSKEFLAGLVMGRDVTVKEYKTDLHGRSVSRVYVDYRDVSTEMVSSGLAWHFKKYSSDDNLAQLEEFARQRKIGLWATANPLPPWDYRAGLKTTSSSAANFVSERSTQASSTETVYITRTGKKYHRGSCSSLAKSKIPISLEEACKKGYGPCSRCNPPQCK